MLSLEELKALLHKKGQKNDKLLILLASFDSPTQVKAMEARAEEAGLDIESWNVPTLLKATKGKAIRVPNGWELTAAGNERLAEIGALTKIPRIQNVASDLRAECAKISNPQTRAFVEEAIQCFELNLCRSAIVMSWLAAVDVLHAAVVAKWLSKFNAEATRRNPKWRNATTTDDLGLMREYDFIECSYKISMVGKSVRDRLQECLNLRNGCGHPNSLSLGPNTVARHLELLIQNVFLKFA